MKIEVYDKKTQEVIHTVDVTGKTMSQAEKVEDGIHVNLDYKKYWTRIVEEPHDQLPKGAS